MSETETKPWYQSRTIIGAAVVVVAQVGKLFGWTLGTEDADALVNDLLTFLGAALAIYGRVKAAKPISKPPAPPA